MGQSTNAILFYGYCWEDETSSPWTIGNEDIPDDEEEEDWEERYAARCGLASDASWCEVDEHCSSACPMPFVAIKASRKVSHRGDATPIDGLVVDPAWDVQLTEFCALMGIPAQASPRWYLVSYWDGF